MDDSRTLLRGDEGFLRSLNLIYLCRVGCLCVSSSSEAERDCLFPPVLFPLRCFYCHSRFQPEKWTENVLFIAAGRSRVRSAHSHSFTLLGAAQYHRCHPVLLTEHLHQLLRSVLLQKLRLSEMRKEKIEPVQGEIKHSSCSVCVHTGTHTFSQSMLTPPHCPTLPSHMLRLLFPSSAVGTCAVSDS